MFRLSAIALGLLAAFASPVVAAPYTAIPNLTGEDVNVVYFTAPGQPANPSVSNVYNDELSIGGSIIVSFYGDGSPYDPQATYNVHNKPGAILTITPVQFSLEFQNVAYPPATFNGAEIQISTGQAGFPKFLSINYLGNEGSNVPPPSAPIVTLDPSGSFISINVQGKHFTSDAEYTWGFVAGIIGDPQFTGFMGQSYQVHGTSGSIYNIMSTPSFQYNALFSYLDSGSARKGTQAFSHPGNYFGRVGAQIKDANGVAQQLLIQSGAVDAGLTLQINNQTVTASEHVFEIGAYKVSLPNEFEVLLESDEFNVRVQNSDFFLNQDVSIGSGLMRQLAQYKQAVKAGAANADELKAALPHGVLGQTWNTAVYNNRWKHIEGHLFDYQLADGVFGTEFKYNKF